MELSFDVELLAPRDAAARAQTQTGRPEALTAGLLGLSRIETKQPAARPELMDLWVAIRQVGEPYASRAEQANVSFDLALPPGVVTVHGNSALLQPRRTFSTMQPSSRRREAGSACPRGRKVRTP